MLTRRKRSITSSISWRGFIILSPNQEPLQTVAPDPPSYHPSDPPTKKPSIYVRKRKGLPARPLHSQLKTRRCFKMWQRGNSLRVSVRARNLTLLKSGWVSTIGWAKAVAILPLGKPRERCSGQGGHHQSRLLILILIELKRWMSLTGWIRSGVCKYVRKRHCVCLLAWWSLLQHAAPLVAEWMLVIQWKW